MGLISAIGRVLAGYLTGPSPTPSSGVPTDQEFLARTVRTGDVLLVDGRQRISTAIKYLTQSTWSHAALCVASGGRGSDQPPRFVEADAIEGVRIVSIAEFEGHHTRICRPVGLDNDDIKAVVDFALTHVGDEYDLANVIDLARYLFPTPPVPVAWRRRMLALGSGEPTKAICSTLVAQAFQSIRYPILPEISREMMDAPECKRCMRDILHIRHHSLFTPRDFDVSPYFEIVKPTLHAGFNHRLLTWSDDRLAHQNVDVD